MLNMYAAIIVQQDNIAVWKTNFVVLLRTVSVMITHIFTTTFLFKQRRNIVSTGNYFNFSEIDHFVSHIIRLKVTAKVNCTILNIN